MQIKTLEFDGKKIAYHDENVFHVQIGKGNGKYKTIHSFIGLLPRAIMEYLARNIGYGYKKRLVCWEFNKPIIARYISKGY
jgi:hypothetical protein